MTRAAVLKLRFVKKQKYFVLLWGHCGPLGYYSFVEPAQKQVENN